MKFTSNDFMELKNITETDFKEQLADLVQELDILWDTKKRSKILKELKELLNSVEI